MIESADIMEQEIMIESAPDDIECSVPMKKWKVEIKEGNPFIDFDKLGHRIHVGSAEWNNESDFVIQ